MKPNEVSQTGSCILKWLKSSLILFKAAFGSPTKFSRRVSVWNVGGLADASQWVRPGPLERCMETPLADGIEPGVDMSKIPQGEWNAIAARYAQGESISRIAQTYGCTPPAIHYILKRNRQRTAQRVEQPLNGRSELLTASTRAALQTPAAPPSRSAEPLREEQEEFRPV